MSFQNKYLKYKSKYLQLKADSKKIDTTKYVNDYTHLRDTTEANYIESIIVDKYFLYIYYNSKFVTIIPLSKLDIRIDDFENILQKKNIREYTNISVQAMDSYFNPIGEPKDLNFEDYETDVEDIYDQEHTLDTYLDSSKHFYRFDISS
uniref:Uncharacterized protein n=1 Tax=viral metagenome TaxID=1070528 RepID=A0A6C0DAT1_9ZZZZ